MASILQKLSSIGKPKDVEAKKDSKEQSGGNQEFAVSVKRAGTSVNIVGKGKWGVAVSALVSLACVGILIWLIAKDIWPMIRDLVGA